MNRTIENYKLFIPILRIIYLVLSLLVILSVCSSSLTKVSNNAVVDEKYILAAMNDDSVYIFVVFGDLVCNIYESSMRSDIWTFYEAAKAQNIDLTFNI